MTYSVSRLQLVCSQTAGELLELPQFLKVVKQTINVISALPFVSRAFEKLIYNQLYGYRNRSKLLFPSSLSLDRCALSLLAYLIVQVTGCLTWIVDKGLYTALIFADLKKVFETMDHEFLLKILERYGVIGPENTLFVSYLCNRMHFCRVNGTSWSLYTINWGVPQGSCLGFFLFLISINNLSFALQSSQVNMYAVDTTLSNSFTNFIDLGENLIMDLRRTFAKV